MVFDKKKLCLYAMSFGGKKREKNKITCPVSKKGNSPIVQISPLVPPQSKLLKGV